MQKIKDVYPGTILEKFFGDKTYISPVMGPSLRLVVAEAAGAEEDAAGKPLVGGSGRIFDSLLHKAGINRSTLSIINTLPFQPPDNLYPTDSAARVYCNTNDAEEIVRFCNEHYVQPVLRAREWTRIDAIGNKSLRLLTGKTEGIMKWRGSPLPLVGEKETRVIGLLHPSYLMRDSGMIPATISDLQKGTQVPPQFYNLQPTLEDVREFASSRTLVFDIETNGFSGSITMVGLCDPTKLYHVTVVPFRGAYIEALKFVFSQSEYLVGQNCISFDLPVLATAGIIPNPKAEVFDTMLMHHLLHPDEPHDLEFISSIYTQMVAWKHLASEDMAFYNACDVDATAQIYLQLRPLLVRFRMMDLYQKLQVPLAKICKQIHDTGIKVDPNRIHTAREKLLIEFHDLEEKLPQELKPYDKTIRIRKPAPAGTIGKSGKPIKFIHVAGAERVVPWQSPKKCEHWLYETLKLPKQIHPKTKAITSSKCLSPEMKVLCHDLIWRRADNIAIGDVLIAFDESNNGRSGRKLRPSVVEGVEKIVEPTYRIVTDNGTIVCSAKHGFLRRKSPRSEFTSSYEWKNADLLAVGDYLGFYLAPWEMDISYEAGWLAGFLDGEGSYSQSLAYYQNNGVALDRLLKYLNQRQQEYAVYPRKVVGNSVQILGAGSGLPLLGAIQPARLGEKFRDKLYGKRVYGKKSVSAKIISIESLGFNEVIAIQTSTKTIIAEGFLTHNSALERLSKKFQLPELDALRKLRSLDELLTTFLKEEDGQRQSITRIHSNFLVHGTATGRLSSSGPNLQNIPAKARFIYVPSFSDWCFVEADFSSLENRLAAWYANDSERLIRLSDPNFNEHRWLASKIYSIPESEITKDMWQYKNGKITNHGADGAMGPNKLAMTHSLPQKVARELIFKWREINCKSAQWQDTVGNEAVKKGILTNAFGRKRWFWSRSGYTEGIRFLPQSTGADICFRTMLGLCYKSIGWPEDVAREVCPVLAPLPHPARLVLQVHDSLLIECPLALREQVVECVQKVATQPWHELAGFSIPIDVKVGEANEGWGELHHI